MKETSQHAKDEVTIVAPDQHSKKKQLIHRMLPKPGQKLFEYSIETNTLKLAEFTTNDVEYTKAAAGNNSGKKALDVKENCFYVLAINFKNAVKQLKKVYVNIEPEISRP